MLRTSTSGSGNPRVVGLEYLSLLNEWVPASSLGAVKSMKGCSIPLPPHGQPRDVINGRFYTLKQDPHNGNSDMDMRRLFVKSLVFADSCHFPSDECQHDRHREGKCRLVLRSGYVWSLVIAERFGKTIFAGRSYFACLVHFFSM